jgi:hypothetical protein
MYSISRSFAFFKLFKNIKKVLESYPKEYVKIAEKGIGIGAPKCY